MTGRPLVVGFDASPDAVRALQWSVDAARTRALPLRVVVARGDLYTLSDWADEWTRGLAEESVEAGRKILAEQGFEGADFAVVDGLPPAVLVAESASAELMAIGSRGHSALAGVIQGSVSQHVSRHASCPVVVVRAAADEGSRRVVVGVDGSESSIGALEFALRHASLHHLEVAVVCAPDHWRGNSWSPPADVVPELMAQLEAKEAKVLDDVEHVIVRHPDVTAVVQEVKGRPARALVDASRSAALVVVGSRGRGAFTGMFLGSVSAEVLREAACPVAVVR
jgi:nucleotide-binding universal stress UspA family protein